MLAAKYLDNKETALEAATTVKNILNKEDGLRKGDDIRNILEKEKNTNYFNIEIYKSFNYKHSPVSILSYRNISTYIQRP